jgi:imidazolonepropionase-like amidohydrolase
MSTPSTAITNVRVFNGQSLTPLRTVVIADGKISANDAIAADTTVDGHGGTLLPGLIDAHIHLSSLDNLKQAAHWGITTMLDMGTKSPALVDSLRHLPGLTDIRSPQSPASAPGGTQTTKMGFDPSTALTGPADAEKFVASRAAEGADYIKVIVEDPAVMGSAALSGPTIAAIVKAAHARQLRVFAHVTSTAGFQLATDAGVDILTHAPLDAPLSPAIVEQIVRKKILSVLTLIMMSGVNQMLNKLPNHSGPVSYQNAKDSVTELHRANVPIIVGTDANDAPGSPFQVKHGESLHEELALLVAAGLTPVEVLRGATILPAQLLDLKDRGAIEPGLRADLVLIEGDPTTDITATRNIQGVWIEGIRAR